jgi:hypothetical protein
MSTEFKIKVFGGTGTGNATVKNSDNSYNDTVPCGGTLTLPDTVYNIFIDNVLQLQFNIPTLKNETINLTWQ